MKLVVTFIFYVSGTFCLLADSPLTSIVFWDLSDDPYVLNIGKIPGKKSLDQDSFQYLINPTNTIDNKYALINALGWEFKSSIKNSDNFLRFLNQRFEKEFNEYRMQNRDDSNFLLRQKDLIKNFMKVSLECEYLKLYNYLLAMDDYLNVSQLELLYNSWKTEFFKGSDFDELIAVLLKSQIKLLQNSYIEFREIECIFVDLEINRMHQFNAIGHSIYLNFC